MSWRARRTSQHACGSLEGVALCSGVIHNTRLSVCLYVASEKRTDAEKRTMLIFFYSLQNCDLIERPAMALESAVLPLYTLPAMFYTGVCRALLISIEADPD